MSLDVILTKPPTQPEQVFASNITHNLGLMAKAAGIYEHCWHPEDIGITKAWQLIEPLRKGLAWLRANETAARRHDDSNGWGLYQDFVPWVETYLSACEAEPGADVSVSR